MNKQEFLDELEEIMQLDAPLTGDEVLETFPEWDSMSNLGVMCMFDMELGLTITADELRVIKTIPELLALAGEHISG
jgi:acyl carrier protein|tara:strand:- start:207 stop:437 length:231 start_codon:yes stop_codon:yes gene_type:complete